MTFLKKYTRVDITNRLKTRSQYFARMLGDSDLDDILSACIRQLDQSIYTPRDLVLTSFQQKVDLRPYQVDEVCNIYFSSDAGLQPVGVEVGLLPLILRGSSVYNFSSVVDFLQMKATLNIMNRQLRTAPDYEYHGGFIVFNRPYEVVAIEYLPFLPDDSAEYEFYTYEFEYLFERSWRLLNQRNAEAGMSSIILGAAKESTAVAQYWKQQLDELDKKWADSAIVSYIG